MGRILLNLLIAYFVITYLITLGRFIQQQWMIHRTTGKHYGKQRINQLREEGNFVQVPVYPLSEIRKNKELAQVRVSVFPRIEGTPDRDGRFVLVLPGGGYAHTCTFTEGYPVAARLNEMGFTAFVLDYRTGTHCRNYAPMEDVAETLKYIEANREKYGVTLEDYALCGFSAGGNLAGMFGSHMRGYEYYGVPKPKMLMLGYPWTNVRHWIDQPYWNPWMTAVGIWLSERGFVYMFGFGATKEQKDSLCVQNHVTEDFPDVFIYAGGRDILVPASRHADVLVEALKEKSVRYEYKQYFRLTHGIGLGYHTSAEGWIEDAVDFWINREEKADK